MNWNGRHLMQECLPSVLNTSYQDYRLIVVDNASTDDSVQWLRDTHPTVEIIRLNENLGFSGGNNRAIEAGTSRYVVLLNNDVEVASDWLSILVERAERDDEVGAVVPKLLQYTDRNRFEYAGACGGFLDDYGYPFARGRMFDTLEEDHKQYDDRDEIFWGSGAALLLRRSALDTCGLLDESFFMHMEEIDLCWRLQRAKYRVVCAPTARAYHMGGASLSPDSPRKVYYNFRNSLLMLYKNGGRREWPRRFATRLVLDTIASARFLLHGRMRLAFAVAKAYLDAHGMKRTYAANRTPSDEAPPPYRGSVVVDYFLKGHKRFSELDSRRFR